MTNIREVITNEDDLSRRYVLRDGFVFSALTSPANVYDAILIKVPNDIRSFYGSQFPTSRTLEEHIDFINKYKIEKATIIADNIEFITKCPTLKYLSIIPGDSVGDGFDYSPLYEMPEIKCLSCETKYGFKEEFKTTVDCARIKGLEDLNAINQYYLNFNTVKTLKDLTLTAYKKEDLSEAFVSPVLDSLYVFQSKLKSLDGIETSSKMQCLYLYHNRSLQDISALKKVKNTLTALHIENCPKITDFSVLGELENVELLRLFGKNELPNLSFLKSMKKLKTFVFDMNVIDGDLSPCLELSYAHNETSKKHYNLKDKDLPKGEYFRGNESIDEWRRFY
jgi:hypothetical protein